MKPPAFQFYASDFLAGTVELSAADVGAYIRLLCYQWASGQLPATPEAVNRVAGCEVSPEVLAKFPNGKNERLEAERVKQAEWRETQSQNGRAGAEKRWHKHGEPNGTANGVAIVSPMANHMAKNSSPSPSPSPSLIPDSVSMPEVAAVAAPQALTDAEWLESLKRNPAYEGIDVSREHAKALTWATANRKTMSRRRFVNWMNRAEKPMDGRIAPFR